MRSRRKILKNSVTCNECRTVLVSVIPDKRIKCICSNQITIYGGNLFFGLDIPRGSSVEFDYEFGDVTD